MWSDPIGFSVSRGQGDAKQWGPVFWCHCFALLVPTKQTSGISMWASSHWPGQSMPVGPFKATSAALLWQRRGRGFIGEEEKPKKEVHQCKKPKANQGCTCFHVARDSSCFGLNWL